ncbi:NAD-dependent epimerase/dehydratase family protein [Nonomuraea angiospora]|uniref:NAD-dependent epimerase/dehydratase family protein n=1 Tax=Nonomuraea angiospora TaxID=46172 RepID=UPI0029A7D50B|nr:NAD-dependent epimerase/dehydratase family protein [Nonomuraea angiospora]MDX3103687.1 NAD-dependent epimerase/dehydratase family protein [Nonomuraea angiospora]
MFTSVGDLEDRLTRPSEPLVAGLAAGSGDLVVLGAGGKMGPTLCRLARRGLDAAGRGGDRVFAVSRWSDRTAAAALAGHGVDIVPFDLLDGDLGRLPDAADVVFMVGAKFGTSDAPYLAWVVNAALPARVAERYDGARVAALSTGNVYPLVPVSSGGSVEGDPVGPVGEYAMSCLGRERIFEHAAATRGTAVTIVRLNYAVDLRYGVLADIGQRVLSGAPVDVTTGHVNVVWQGYANEVVLRSLAHATGGTPFTLNLTGPETASVRRVAAAFAERLGTPVSFEGSEAATALLNDATLCHRLFGYPHVPLGTLIDWQAAWLAAGLPTSGKPTKFAIRDGRF